MIEKVIRHETGCKVLAAYGANPHGEPLFRMVRADSRREWQMGEWRPKYPKFGTQWIIEQWVEPEKYGSKEFWESAKDESGGSLLGPYPDKGDYEFTFPVWDEHDQPIENPGDHHLQVMGYIALKNRGLTRSMRWSMIQQAQEEAERIKRKKLEDMIADARPLRGGEAERKYAEELEEAAKRNPISNITPGASLGGGELNA